MGEIVERFDVAELAERRLEWLKAYRAELGRKDEEIAELKRRIASLESVIDNLHADK